MSEFLVAKEGFDAKPIPAASPEVADWAIEKFNSIATLLTNSNEYRRMKDGKLRFKSPVDRAVGLEELSSDTEAQHARHDKEGGVTGIEVRTDSGTGKIRYACLEGDYPVQPKADGGYRAYNRDSWVARFQFPEGGRGGRNLVLDTWTLPLNNLEDIIEGKSGEERGAALSEYSQAHGDLFRNLDPQGIPIGAISKEHTVFGREGDPVMPDRFDELADLMDTFYDAAQDVADQNIRS